MEKVLWTLVLTIALLGAAHAAPATIYDGRLTEQNNGSQLVFDLSDPVRYSRFFLDAPPRLVIDIRNARLSDRLLSERLRSHDVTTVRAAPRNGGRDVRLVMELPNRLATKISLIRDSAYRLVIDFFRERSTTTLASTPTQTARAATPPIQLQTQSASTRARPRQQPLTLLSRVPAQTPRTTNDKPPQRVTKKPPTPPNRPFVVAIDPGHGGRDPGAIGPSGVFEKDVVMQISKRLELLIDRQPNMKACLTRSKDVYLKLSQRISVARKRCKANMFVSIHADAYEKAESAGASVFVLSNKGASSAMARFLAQHENESGGGDPFSVSDPTLKKVLVEMVQDAVMAESEALGKQVLDELGQIAKLHGRKRVENAGFAVLKAPDFPSILVETAFISNPEEERKLLDTTYQTQLAKAILDGIRGYVTSRPQLVAQHGALASR